MRYIQLSTLPLPATADLATIFPFLQEDGETYRLAWLVSGGNQAAGAALETLGFKRDNTTDHGAKPAGKWSFYTCIAPQDDTEEHRAPLASLSSANGTSLNRALSTYIDWDVPIGGTVVQPAALTIVRKILDTALHRGGAKFPLKKLEYGPVNDREWRLAKATAADVAVSFKLPIDGGAPHTAPVAATWDVEPLADAGGFWGGGRLRINAVAVVGGPNERIALDGAALTTTSENGVDIQLAYEAETAGIKIGILNSSAFELTIASQPLRVRYGQSSVGLLLYSSGVGNEIGLRFMLTFPVIMKAVGDAQDALATTIPLFDEDSLSRGLAFTFDAVISADFDADREPMLVCDETRGWMFDSEINRRSFLNAVDHLGAKPLFSSLGMGGQDLSIADLVGDTLGGVAFGLCRAEGLPRVEAKLQGNVLRVPVGLTVSVGGQPLEFTIELALDLTSFRLSSNRLSFRLPRAVHGQPAQVLDLNVMAVLLPNRDPDAEVKGPDGYDGYLDFESGEFALISSPNQPGPQILFPGNLDAQGLKKRLLFSLAGDFDPEAWKPGSRAGNSDGQKTYFRINRDGLSMQAKVETSHAATVLSDVPAMPDVTVSPKAEKDGRISEFVIVDNVIRAGAVFCEMDVPGTDDLTAELELGFRQNQRGEPPVVYAALTTDSEAPLTQLSVGYLQARIDNIRGWRLTWNTANNDWDLKLPTDGALSLSPRTTSDGGIEDLRKDDIIRFRGLDLVNLHKGADEIDLPLDDFVEFKLLGGMFQVRLTQLRFGWGESFFLTCDQADFQFQQADSLDVTITAGGLRLDFLGGTRMKLRNPSSLGIDVVIGDSVRYRGAVAWVDDDREHYFAAAGTLSIKGLPEASTLLKLGVGRKENGQLVPNVVFFGSVEQEVQLFSGVVAKSFGAGIGINNRLRGIEERPNAETVLARIDDIKPADIAGWEFVRRNGFFLSIVGTTELTSNTGANDTVNAYVASLVLSIDVDLNVVAAGKLWLSSSVAYTRNPSNRNRPALVGAIVISPRQQLISAALESRPNPAVEANEQLSNILDKGHVKFSFLMSPKVVDFFLQDVSYRADFLGIEMLYQGSLRLAVFRGVVLLRATQQITGHFHRRLEGGMGGFEARGDLSLLVEFGGLLSSKGLAAYGLIDFSLSLLVRAWITIGFSFTIGCGRWKKRISFSKTFTLADTRLELGLFGAIAFDESGDFGFEGTLSISVSICGYRLSISPSVKFNEQVIPRVRGRVAAFEQRLEEYRRELLGGGVREAIPEAAALALAAQSEQWLWYQRGDWHLLIPRANRKWLVPEAAPGPSDQDGLVTLNFEQQVTLLEMIDAAGNPVAKVIPPWQKQDWPQVERNARLAQLEEAETIMAETAGPEGQSFEQFPLYTDPRVETAARDYWPEDEFARPDFAPPLAMRSVDALVSSTSLPDTFDSDYRRLVDYLFWRSRALRHQLHRNGDTDDSEDALANRGGLVALLLDELQAARDNPKHKSAWRGEPRTIEPQTHLGWIFRMPLAGNQPDGYRFRITRNGDTDAAPIVVTRPLDDIQQARRLARPLHPRQAFVIDQVGDATGKGERGRVVVKLPVKLDPRLFGAKFDEVQRDEVSSANLPGDLSPTLSHFQVWRRLPWESAPQLVGNQLRPEMTPVEEQPDSQLSERAVVVGPYLFTDEFRTLDRRLTPESIVPEMTEIEYHLKLIAVGEDTSSPSPQGAVPWPLIRLYVPPRVTFPQKPGMVLLAAGLFDDRDSLEFTLASLETESTRPATIVRDGVEQLLTPEDFELWVSNGTDTVGRGFYVGGEAGSDGTDATTDPLLNNVKTTPPASEFDTLDKRRVQFQPVQDHAGWFTIGADAVEALGLRAGLAFRFFARERARGGDGQLRAQGPLLELKPLLFRADGSRERPSAIKTAESASGGQSPWSWKTVPRFRPVDDVERVPAADRNHVVKDEFSLVPVVAQLRPLELWNDLLTPDPQPAKLRRLRRRLGLSWQADLGAGGVELMVRDADDSSLQQRLLCETLAEDVFRRRTTDFRNVSLWQLTREEQIQRRGFDHRPASEVDDPDVKPEYFLHLDGPNPVLQDLDQRSRALSLALESTTANWRDVYPPLKNWLTAVFSFEKSPLNLNDRPLREVLEQIRSLTEHALTGRFDASMTDLAKFDDAARRRLEQELTEYLRQIDATAIDERQLQDDTEEQRRTARRTILDLRLARKLAAIVRRRRNVVSELFSGASQRVPEAGDTLDAGYWLPRGKRWEELRTEHQRLSTELGGRLPLSERLLQWFPAIDGKNPSTCRASQLLKGALDELQSLAKLEDPDNGRRERRRELASSVVTKAAGLTAALIEIRKKLGDKGWMLVTRPHHQVATTRDEDGAVAPVVTPLQTFRSDEQRVGADNAATPDNEVVALANLLERMGFAVDLAMFDELQQPVPQAELLRMLDESGIGGNATTVCLVLAGREQDSEYRGGFPDPTGAKLWEPFVGYSFVKLAVAPKPFWELLASNLKDADNLQALADWFRWRQVTFDASKDDEIALAERLGRIAAYLRSIKRDDDKRDTSETSDTLRVRVESRDRRWSSVPAVQGFAHVDWEVPDRRGHRFVVGARLVSRYEPFIRWALGIPGQSAAAWMDESDSDVVPVRRMIADVDEEHPSLLPISVYPHPELIRFSYILPPAGARSIYNVVSAVRTGYVGCRLSFRRRLIDHEKESRRWRQVLADAEWLTTEIDDPLPVVRRTPRKSTSDVRLFRHERLIELEEQPYFCEYGLDVHSQFDADALQPLSSPVAFDGGAARRSPGWIAVRHAKLTLCSENATRRQYIVEIRLTRTGDLLGGPEFVSGPPLEPVTVAVRNGAATNLSIPPQRLPDLAFSYDMYYWANPEESAEPYFVSLLSVKLPWHPSFRMPEQSKEQSKKPLGAWVQGYDSRIEITAEGVKPEPWQPIQIGANLAYVVRFPMAVKRKDGEEWLLEEPSRCFLRATRDGKVSLPILLEAQS
jgi:hypothetical protein